ncbi:MAG: RHS repeat-associated core domain-containing protein [Cyclobacteriaceae bacterium]|nr:RHS repeat-associated core domain-containing protein [Cyclobacteriaceae bacterium]
MYINEIEVTKLAAAAPEYQYHLKDHLGNVRMTFTSSPAAASNFTAGFETANQAAEGAAFMHYPSGGQINTQATNAHTGNNSELLNGGYNGQVGVTKTFSVMPGDQVSIQAYAKYGTPSGTATNYSGFAAALLSAFSLPVPVQGEVGTASSGVNAFATWEIGATGNLANSDARKVFVTIILFDRNYNFLDASYSASSSSGSLISASYTVREPGYAYVYVSNEHNYLLDVYFDDVAVTFTPSMVVGVNEYYPFGLTFNSYSRENSLANQYQYNGKEKQTALGLGWFDYGARMYQPELGRFGTIDKFADRFARYSPYTYATDNPVLFTDPDGNYPVNIVNANGVLTRSFMHLINISLGISNGTLANTQISYNKDVWYSPHSFTGYESGGGITIHHNIILTDDFDTKGGSIYQTMRDVTKWFGLVPHELGHRVQRDRSILYLTPYLLQAAGAAIQNGSVDASIIHDKIPMEAEANQYQERFDEFLAFFNYKDKKGRDRNKITDLFSGGRKDDDFIISKLNQYKSEYDKAQEKEAKEKSEGWTSMVSNFSSLQEGTYTWNGSSWVRQ